MKLQKNLIVLLAFSLLFLYSCNKFENVIPVEENKMTDLSVPSNFNWSTFNNNVIQQQR